MKCPRCAGVKWKTLETRSEEKAIARRKECLACEQRIWTSEKFDCVVKAKIKRAPPVKKEKPAKVKKVKARSFIKRNVDAMLKMESRRDSAMDYYSEDNDYLNKW